MGYSQPEARLKQSPLPGSVEYSVSLPHGNRVQLVGNLIVISHDPHNISMFNTRVHITWLRSRNVHTIDVNFILSQMLAKEFSIQ